MTTKTNSRTTSTSSSATWRIPMMDCAAEESEIRRSLEAISDVQSSSFNLGARTLTLKASESALSQARDAIQKAGFEVQDVAPAGGPGAGAQDDHGAFGSNITKLVLALVLASAAEGVSFYGATTMLLKGAEFGLAALAILLAGFDTYRKGINSLRHLKLNITALMSVAVTGAFLIGQWPEAAMVMALYAIAELIEAKSLDRARNAIKSLMALAPEEADVQQVDGTWFVTRVENVAIDQVFRIRPGERVPLDGTITHGSSAIDQAPVTGESIPVDKTVGDPVFAGTINQSGELKVRVTAAASNTTLARIIHAVEEAQGSRAPTQRFVDQFAAIYTPAVFVIAALVAVATPLALGWTWTQALYKALVLLVIACPCALVISTPVTVVSALASAARRGVLIKGGTYLEEARKLRAIALDKTGTITEGKPKMVAFENLDVIPVDAAKRLAAALAGRSDHPVSRAIVNGLELQADDEVSDFTALTGRGVKGVINGSSYVLGNYRLIKERSQSSSQLDKKLKWLEEQGGTVTLLASDAAVLAIMSVSDTIKASSKDAIKELKALGIVSVMLTGDNRTTARVIAEHAGISDSRGNMLPEDKLKAVEELKTKYGHVGMTGDGINDAPALAKADIGIAMGGAGTDTAMEAADIVVMNDDLRNIPSTIELSKRTHKVLWQNISLALGIKGVFFFLAVFGSATMWMAVFADMGASLLVVANGLRLLRDRKAA